MGDLPSSIPYLSLIPTLSYAYPYVIHTMNGGSPTDEDPDDIAAPPGCRNMKRCVLDVERTPEVVD